MPHRLAHHSDEELLQLLRDGDTAAADQLWRRHHPAALATARRVTSGSRDAEDVAAEAFLAMLRALLSGSGPTQSIRGYLAMAVRHGAAAAARKHDQDTLIGGSSELDRVLPAESGPESRVPRQVLVREACRSLPPRHRLVLWRTVVEGASASEVAHDLGISPNAVAALTRRARLGLRRAYLQARDADTGPPNRSGRWARQRAR
jgi:RNA polymerase sigma factor (sigma-70 family)